METLYGEKSRWRGHVAARSSTVVRYLVSGCGCGWRLGCSTVGGRESTLLVYEVDSIEALWTSCFERLTRELTLNVRKWSVLQLNSSQSSSRARGVKRKLFVAQTQRAYESNESSA
jgi:hypothetical protein